MQSLYLNILDATYKYIYIYINTSEEGNLKTCLSKELKSMFSLVSNPRIYWFCIEEMLS